GGNVTLQNATDSTDAFTIQTAGGADTLFTADTSNNRLVVGNATGTGGTNTTLLVVDSATGDPTGVAGAMYYDSANNKFRCYTTQWVDCDTGSGNTTRVTLSPEYPGGTLYADGSNNNGTMLADYDSTDRRNYYSWSSSQGSLQDYDIVISTTIPSDYVGNLSGWNVWA